MLRERGESPYVEYATSAGLFTSNTPSTRKGKLIKHLRMSDEERFQKRLELLFDPLDLRSKTVLDVGAGEGLYSAYAAHLGADRVVALEPEVEGSSSQMFETLTQVATDYEAIEPERKILEEYDYDQSEFDVVLLHNSVNHLDEEACMQLHESPRARDRYHDLFELLSEMTTSRRSLVIADVARTDMWRRLGVPNPFPGNFERDKHQSPGLWIGLLEKHDFEGRRVEWRSYLSGFSGVGDLLFSNRAAAYLTKPRFIIELERK